MKVVLTEEAADQLERQISYLVEMNAIQAARRLQDRVVHFLREHLAHFPRTGRPIGKANLLETWIPGTQLVLWYRVESDELCVVAIWHAAQDRK